jgi:transcription elongation factor Elf1
MDEIFIKEKILELKRQVKYYEKELTKVCQHEKVSPSFDKYNNYSDDYIFVCDNCGMTFVTKDPNFKYKGK